MPARVIRLAERFNDGAFSTVEDAFKQISLALDDMDKHGYKPRKCLLHMYFENDAGEYAMATARGGCRNLIEALGLQELFAHGPGEAVEPGNDAA